MLSYWYKHTVTQKTFQQDTLKHTWLYVEPVGRVQRLVATCVVYVRDGRYAGARCYGTSPYPVQEEAHTRELDVGVWDGRLLPHTLLFVDQKICTNKQTPVPTI